MYLKYSFWVQYLVSRCQNEPNKTQEKAANLNVEQDRCIDPQRINAFFHAHIVGRVLEEIGKEYHA